MISQKSQKVDFNLEIPRDFGIFRHKNLKIPGLGIPEKPSLNVMLRNVWFLGDNFKFSVFTKLKKLTKFFSY